ncbi:hypothetical protein [Bacillus cereus]|uniref:hypothetical protein n=1 Tax=Bacillus cereus TaxID=1396 RepID=UPI003207992E
MFEHEEQEIIVLKQMKDNINITISAELFILYIGVPPHAHQLKVFYYPQVQKNVILS